MLDDYQSHYQAEPNHPTPLVQCPFFATSLLDLNGSVTRENASGRCVLVCMEGSAQLQTPDTIQTIGAQTAVLLTDCTSFVLNGQARMLEVVY